MADLAAPDEVRSAAEELGPLDAIIHNAGVLERRSLVPVNVVAHLS